MFKNHRGQVRSGWKIAIMMLITIVVILICGTIISLIQVALAYSQSLVDGNLDMNELKQNMESNSVLNGIILFVQEAMFIIVPLVIWKFFIKRSFTNMGLTSIKKNYKDLFAGLLFGIVSISVVFLLLVITGNAEVKSWIPHFEIEQLLYIFVFIAVGFAEEIFTRGYMMSVLRQTGNAYVAVMVSSIIFALMHSMNSGLSLVAYLNLALVGILFGFMYLKSGNIWMCIGFHITWNYFQGYVFGFKVSGQSTKGILTTGYPNSNVFNGGAFGPEGGLFVTIVILIGLLYVHHYYKNSNYDFIASENISMSSGDPLYANSTTK